MRLRTLRNTMKLQGKTVLVRIDANVPIKRGRAVDGKHGRIARAAVDLEWLRQRGARIVILTHLGRPNGRRIAAYSTAPVARRLKELLGGTIKHSRHVIGPQVERQVSHLEDGDILVLENLRYDAREQENAKSFATTLAGLGDIYVNDAFGNSHRAHVSMDAITDELPSYAGPSLVHEVDVLSEVFDRPKKPFVLVMGGLKAKGKIPVMRKLLKQADVIAVGGALATAFLVAHNIPVGQSVFDKAGVAAAKRLLRNHRDKFLLPIDVRVAKSLRARSPKTRSIWDIGPNETIVDLGPQSMRQIRKELKRAKMVVWNGPFGYCENKAFCEGTESLARAIARQTGKTKTVVGGGDTLPVVDGLNLANRYTLLSTGGGAMLDFLAGKKLPGIEALKI